MGIPPQLRLGSGRRETSVRGQSARGIGLRECGNPGIPRVRAKYDVHPANAVRDGSARHLAVWSVVRVRAAPLRARVPAGSPARDGSAAALAGSGLPAAVREGVVRAVAPARSPGVAPTSAAQMTAPFPSVAPSLGASRNQPAGRPRGRAVRWQEQWLQEVGPALM